MVRIRYNVLSHMQKTHAGERLKAWRMCLGLLQREAAARVGATQAMWSQWETGLVQPDAKSCVALQLVTGIEPAAWYPDVVERVLALVAA